ncbi:MAG: M3 family metallopeptidase [Xanthomonadales bacterium]
MSNPLRPSGDSPGLPEFGAIRPGHVMPALAELLEDYREGIEGLLASGVTGWALVEAEVEWADRVARAWSPVSHLNSVADDADLRDAYNAGLERLTEHANWRQQHAGIFGAYRDLRQSAGFSGLDPVQQRIVELELRDFHLAGVDLPPAEQAEYRDIVMRLSKLGAKFSENLLDATRAWTLRLDSPARLAGLPEAEMKLLAGLAKTRQQDGWLVDLSAPSFQAVMTYAEDRALRREVYEAYATRASDVGPNAGRWDNGPLIAEILDLRHRLARLLGFGNYVAYALATRMADTPRTLQAFLEELAVAARPAARAQFDRLSDFARAHGADDPLAAWDVAFWSERLRQHELNLSDEELKPFFPAPRMIEALRHLTTELFGLQLREDASVATWHPDVRYYWLVDDAGHEIAGLYMDLYARPDKRGGAWMDVCRSRRRRDAHVQRPVAYLTCNLAPPVDGRPSLMTHGEVQTLFHEYGHCLHHLLTRIDWPQVNGIHNVEWDAVELPSQLFENWAWDDALLTRFARHHRTDEPLPEALKRRLLASRHFLKALFLVRQLEYGLVDLHLHLDYDPDQPADPRSVLADTRARVAVVPVPDWSRFLNGFSHIFGGGYAAGYYSYLWAEQLAADAWGRFSAEGAFNRETGADLEREILAVGASRPALDSFVAFRGRAPDPAPLLDSYGLGD